MQTDVPRFFLLSGMVFNILYLGLLAHILPGEVRCGGYGGVREGQATIMSSLPMSERILFEPSSSQIAPGSTEQRCRDES